MDFQEKAKWKGRALIKDLRAKKTNIVHMDLISVRPSHLRIDFSASLGIYLGALAMNERELVMVLMPQKTVYKGKPNSASITQVTPLPFNPRRLINILFEFEPESSDWSCTRDKNDFLKECTVGQGQWKITWSNRQGSRRTVNISGKQHMIQLDLGGFDPQVETTDQTFQLTTPAGFVVKSL